MARPRKPTAVKKLQGTLQPCRTNPDEPVPQFPLKKIKAPDYLDKRAQDLWTFAIAQAPEELLTSLDFAVFSCWADTMSKIIECQNIIDVEGAFILTEAGTSKPHPALKMQNELKVILRGYLTELGFTPASRSKVSVIKKKDDTVNGFAEL